MPPKVQYTREKIINCGLHLVRMGGWSALSTRSLARELCASPAPIYSTFRSMEDLAREIILAIIEIQRSFMMKNYTADLWHDHGIGYVFFGMEEPRLFLAINNDRYFEAGKQFGQEIWDECVAQLANYEPFDGLSSEQLHDIQLKRWMLVHGLAFHCCFAPAGTVNNERIISHVVNGSNALLYGLTHQNNA